MGEKGYALINGWGTFWLGVAGTFWEGKCTLLKGYGSMLEGWGNEREGISIPQKGDSTGGVCYSTI